ASPSPLAQKARDLVAGFLVTMDDMLAGGLAADGDAIELALRMNKRLGASDNAHFLGTAGRGAFEHGEDGGSRVAQRVRRAVAAQARSDQQRGEQIAGAVRTDRQFWCAHAPGICAL